MTFSVTQSSRGICDACGSETELVENLCHLCRRQRLKQKNVRVGGAVLAAGGLIIIGIMSYLIYCLDQLIIQSRNPQSLNRWTASPRETELMMSVLYFVLAYGIVYGFTGLWHLVTGRVNKPLFFVMSGMGMVLFIGAQIFAGSG